MTKAEYRQYFAECRKYVKLTVIAKENGIHVSNLSHFINDGVDFLMSLEMCEKLYNAIAATLEKIV